MTKETDTLPTPCTSLNPDSTAEVQAPHVIPSTFRVVVVKCAVGVAGLEAAAAPRRRGCECGEDPISLGGAFEVDGEIGDHSADCDFGEF